MLDTPLNELPLPVRAVSLMNYRGFVTIRDVLESIARDGGASITGTPNFGRKSWNETLDAFREAGVDIPHHWTYETMNVRRAAPKVDREPGQSVYLLRSEMAALLNIPDLPDAMRQKLNRAIAQVR